MEHPSDQPQQEHSERLTITRPGGYKGRKDANMYTISRLASGFWAVWYGSEWIDAAQPTEEAARDLAAKLEKERRP